MISGILRTKKLRVWGLRFHVVHCDQNNMCLIMEQVYMHVGMLPFWHLEKAQGWIWSSYFLVV